MRTAFGLACDGPAGYLTPASTGGPPAPGAAAVEAVFRRWRSGAGVPTDFDDPVETGRAAFAGLAGVPVERVALGATVSTLVGLIAASLPAGARVLVAEGEFTSVSWPFAAAGVAVTEVPLAEIGERATGFDVVAVSTVQSADGAVADLAALRAVQASGTRVVLDATQSLGWFDADLSWADAVVAAGYKWLLCPRGTAWLALTPDWPVTPRLAGWFAGEDVWSSVYGLPLRLAPGARALDTSPVWFAHAGAAVALPWLAGLDRAAVHAHCVELADAFRGGLGMAPAGSAIVSVRRPDAMERLAAAGVTASARAGAARLAFHLYNTHADVALALRALGGEDPGYG